MINGMNWDYFPRGTNYSFNFWNQSDDFIIAALDSEMGLLKNMGVKNVAWTTDKQSFELSRIDNLENDFLTRRRNQVETGLGQFEENGS